MALLLPAPPAAKDAEYDDVMAALNGGDSPQHIKFKALVEACFDELTQLGDITDAIKHSEDFIAARTAKFNEIMASFNDLDEAEMARLGGLIQSQPKMTATSFFDDVLPS